MHCFEYPGWDLLVFFFFPQQVFALRKECFINLFLDFMLASIYTCVPIIFLKVIWVEVKLLNETLQYLKHIFFFSKLYVYLSIVLHFPNPCFILLPLYFFISCVETWGKPRWGPNVKEFTRRFDPIETKGEGPRRLKNLYFLYLIELRALSKVAPYFERSVVDLYTGNGHEDAESKALLLEIFRDTK